VVHADRREADRREASTRPTSDRYGQRVAWLQLLAIAAGVLVISWAVLVVLARRLPPGLLKDLAAVLPACVTTARRLRGDPRVPRRVKLVVLGAGLWVLSPVDLIPESLPVIGPLDDVVVVALALRYAARRIPRDALEEAWPADSRILDRLLGVRRRTCTPVGEDDGDGGCGEASRS
jgi:uncharacterized membrane protein YkvA (DUF1232 family)